MRYCRLLVIIPMLLLGPIAAQEPDAKSKPAGKSNQKKDSGQNKAKNKKAAIKREKPTHADVAYGSHERHRIDFWKTDADKPTPVVVYIHGGGWQNGDKSGFGTANQLKPYLSAGISVAAINYRLIAHAHQDKVEPPVKAPLHDAARALQFIRSKANEWNIDKTRIGATGGSAGACTSLWLAFHDDLADPKSDDPVARESTRLTCAAVTGAQTSLDPKQVREWIVNANYGGHAFGYGVKPEERGKAFELALTNRDKIMPWIKEYSPIELLTKDDPPILLDYGTKELPPAGEAKPDPTHSPLYGTHLADAMKKVGVPAIVVYKDAPGSPLPTIPEYLVKHLKK